jgi:ribosomal protein RSM22 (predicted rRNA methylase)
MLPEALRDALLEEASAWPPGVLAKAADELSEAYRAGRPFRFGADEYRIAYALVRMPATFAVLERVFEEIRDIGIRSLLDLGAGPGTAAWAASEVFGALERVTLIEEDPRLIDLGKRLCGAGSQPAASRLVSTLPPLKWHTADIRVSPLEPHDLVTLSYVLGELEEPDALRVLRKAWKAASEALLVIEPGTPRGFARIRLLRDELISLGAHIAAPCPHAAACPMPPNDWCHFSRRLERTPLHRTLKHGSMGYEDEKYSYVAATRAALEPAPARILRHPMRYPGHVKLRLCTPEGLRDETVTRSQKQAWRAIRHAVWGDRL